MAGDKIREETVRCNMTLAAATHNALKTMAERGGTSVTRAVENFTRAYGDEFLKTLGSGGGGAADAEDDKPLDLQSMFERLKDCIRAGATQAVADVTAWMEAESIAARDAAERAEAEKPTQTDTICRLAAGLVERLYVDYSGGSETEGGRLLRAENAFIALLGSLLHDTVLEVYAAELQSEDASVFARYKTMAEQRSDQMRELVAYRDRGERRSQAARDRRRKMRGDVTNMPSDWMAARERRDAGRMIHTADGWKTPEELTDYELRQVMAAITKRNECESDYISAAALAAEAAVSPMIQDEAELDADWERRTDMAYAKTWLQHSGEEQYI